jgi:uncharacterized membrane protein (Fun14 family)
MPVLLRVLAQGGDPSPLNENNIRGFILLMGIGFIVGTAGHVVKSKAMVAAGVIMIFIATVLLPLGVDLTD